MKTIKLKEKYIERLNSHCWIFSNEIEKHDFSVLNGEICRVEYSDGKLCGVGFYNPHSLISIRLLKKNSDVIEDDFFINRIRQAYEYRKQLGIVESGRVFFGESDGIGGLVMDKYNDVITIEILSSGVELIIDRIKEAVNEIFKPRAIVIFRDHQYRLLEGLKIEKPEIIGSLPKKIIIEENGVRFQIDIFLQKSGWYFDQRENRALIIPYVKGKKVLDLYCYTGGFSIIAAKNGAEIVWGIDTSEKAIELAKTNAKLNNISSKVVFKKESAPHILDALLKGELPVKPDFILIDPPNLVRNKKHLHKAKRHYIRLLKYAIKGIEKGGFIGFSTCSQLIDDEIFNEIVTTAAVKSKRKSFIIQTGTQAKDHPIIAGMKETKYLRFVLLNVVE